MTTYHGRVSSGGDAAVHELAELIVSKLAVGPHSTNAYVLRCRATGEELLVDAAASAPRILTVCGDGPCRQVLTTHCHRRHWGALADVVAATGATTLAHPEDVPGIDVPTDQPVGHDDVVRVGAATLTVIHLPGHTPGSIALLYDDPTGAPHLFSGDALTPDSTAARTPQRGAGSASSARTRVLDRLPDETWVYPGHGDDTNLGLLRSPAPG